MTEAALFHTLEVLIVLALTILFFAGPWQGFCAASSRRRLFELRDRLFSLALDGRIEFDDPAYRATRDWLNDRIRRADGNVFGVPIAFLIAHRGGVPRTRTLDDVFAQVEDRELRAELKAIHARAIRIRLEHMLIRSPMLPVFAALAPVLILIFKARGGLPAFLRWLADIADAANCAAFPERSSE
ncbi:MAG: hypothetical protein OYG32_14775 [Rhodospirillaceae bacterium]|nr:hypothetical protein [Rhodospirillaceae bacterium]